VILVDSNVIVDVLSQDPAWRAWSEPALSDAADHDDVVINPIICAEISAGSTTIAALDSQLSPDTVRRLPLPYEAGFVAGRAFVEYRRRGGQRTSPLPDFSIGAHAAIAGLKRLTRDSSRYTTYFPKVRLISRQ
jgi:predicted nucleic acid-binding protein